jgi:universal stress protein A
MFPIKKILCPTDFSAPSFLAIDAAIELAKIAGAEIIMIHAVPPLPAVTHPTAATVFDTGAYLREMLTHGRESMQHLIKEKMPDKMPVRSMVLSGNPADEIIRAADNEEVNLIVIATHGFTGWRRFVFGSVTERVVRLSTCPVLTIPAPVG